MGVAKKQPQSAGEHPVLRKGREAPLDDEPVTEKDAAAIRKGLEAEVSGDVLSHEELKRQLGL